MNVLITGYTGFIGSYLWKAVKNKDYVTEVFGLSTDECFETFDLNNQRFDTIYHLAAYSIVAKGNKTLFKNPKLTTDILDVYKEYEGKSFVHTSTNSIVMECPNFYSLSKKMAEEICLFYVRKYNINVCSIRVPSVYGPGMKSKTVIDKFIRAALKDEDITLYDRGERKQSFGYVKDVAAILELTGRESFRGVFSYPVQRISMKVLAETVIEVLNSKSVTKYVDNNELIYNTSNHKALPFKQQYGLEGGIKDYAKWIKEERDRC